MNHDPSEMAAQLAAMQKLMAEQQATLEREREERRRKEAELDKLRFRADSSLDSVNSSTKSSTELNEVDALRRQLMAREQELREKEEQIREKDERLSVLSQRSETNSVISEDTPGYNLMNEFFPQNNHHHPRLRSGETAPAEHQQPACECTERGFRRCVQYKRDVCTCSVSCTFVRDYFKPPKGHSFFQT